MQQSQPTAPVVAPGEPLWARANQPIPPEESISNPNTVEIASPPASTGAQSAPAQQTPLAQQADGGQSSEQSNASPAATAASDIALDQSARVQRILAAYGKSAGAGQQSLGEGRQMLSDRLESAGLRVAASPHFPSYGGARVGALRTLSFDNVNPIVSKQVMDRYSIHITNKYISQSGPSYLNSAASGGSVYQPSNKPGYYEVFEISPQAYQKMVVLEQNWLVSHGYDPATTFADTVEFGIVQAGPGQWDLGILHMEVRQVAEIGKLMLTKSIAPTPASTPIP